MYVCERSIDHVQVAFVGCLYIIMPDVDDVSLGPFP